MDLHGAPAIEPINREPKRLTKREYEVWLRELVQSVPVLHVDLIEAHAAGNRVLIAYDEAVKRWIADAALCLLEMPDAPQS